VGSEVTEKIDSECGKVYTNKVFKHSKGDVMVLTEGGAEKHVSILDSLEELASAVKGLETRVLDGLDGRTKIYRIFRPEVPCNSTEAGKVQAVQARSEIRAIIEGLTNDVRRIEGYVADIASSIE